MLKECCVKSSCLIDEMAHCSIKDGKRSPALSSLVYNSISRAKPEQSFYHPVTTPQQKRGSGKKRPAEQNENGFNETTKLNLVPIWSKLYSAQWVYSGHNKQESTHQKQNGKQVSPRRKKNRCRFRRTSHPQQISSFILYGLGYTCSKLSSAALTDSKWLTACNPWLAKDSVPTKQGHKCWQGPVAFEGKAFIYLLERDWFCSSQMGDARANSGTKITADLTDIVSWGFSHWCHMRGKITEAVSTRRVLKSVLGHVTAKPEPQQRDTVS